jgi:nickel-dependent lactate racemase
MTESHINLEFMDARYKLHTETVVGYVEAGYCGTAKATILPGDRVDTISDLACWKSWFDFIS